MRYQSMLSFAALAAAAAIVAGVVYSEVAPLLGAVSHSVGALLAGGI